LKKSLTQRRKAAKKDKKKTEGQEEEGQQGREPTRNSSLPLLLVFLCGFAPLREALLVFFHLVPDG
jgi:hypothetical protein